MTLQTLIPTEIEHAQQYSDVPRIVLSENSIGETQAALPKDLKADLLRLYDINYFLKHMKEAPEGTVSGDRVSWLGRIPLVNNGKLELFMYGAQAVVGDFIGEEITAQDYLYTGEGPSEPNSSGIPDILSLKYIHPKAEGNSEITETLTMKPGGIRSYRRTNQPPSTGPKSHPKEREFSINLATLNVVDTDPKRIDSPILAEGLFCIEDFITNVHELMYGV